MAPFTLGVCNFINSIPFLMIFNALNAPIEGFRVPLETTRNNGTFPLDLACLEHLNVKLQFNCNSIISQFTIFLTIKYLTHMFYLQIPCYKIYKKGFFSYVFTLKYMCHFGMSLKKLHLKIKHKF